MAEDEDRQFEAAVKTAVEQARRRASVSPSARDAQAQRLRHEADKLVRTADQISEAPAMGSAAKELENTFDHLCRFLKGCRRVAIVCLFGRDQEKMPTWFRSRAFRFTRRNSFHSSHCAPN